jgi:hypothetical protein
MTISTLNKTKLMSVVTITMAFIIVATITNTIVNGTTPNYTRNHLIGDTNGA